MAELFAENLLSHVWRLRKKMKNACGAFWCLIYPSLGAWSCACHTESSVDLRHLCKKEREQIPKKKSVYLKCWYGERASGTEQGQGNDSFLYQPQAGISLSPPSGCAASFVAFCATRA